jgi:site-specific DNA recombinase
MKRFFALRGHWHAKRQGKTMNEIRPASELSIKKAVIYARFSTDLQNERSIEDQITLCRGYASREGIDIIEVFEDRARSGGSVMGRSGLLRLLDQARDRSFDVVVVEALDRLSRDMEDLAGIHKRLSFLGIEIRAVHEGVVNTVLVGLRGLVGQLYREDNAHKVRRGLAGRIGQGLNAGGKAYGYAPAAGQKGKRIIVEAEAKIVQRIFEEYVAGRTPREIAYDLNIESISPPRGRSWNASTINGNMQRGTGIIQNELYAGRLVWNKVRMIKDPDTGKRLSRPNAKNDWQTTNVPDLRIISQKLFDAAQSRKQARGITHPNHQRRPRHMLSGLLRCGACGSGMSTNGKDKSGRIRIRCSAATESGACREAKTFYLKTVEGAVLAGLKAEMWHPSVIAEYVRTYHDERKRLSAKANAKRARLELRHGELKREIDRLVDAIAKGHGDPAVLGPRSSILDEERKQVVMELNAEPAADDVISLHPAVLARYEQQLAHLQDALSKGVNAGDSEAAEAIRDLVETITVFRNPSHPGGVTVEIVGRLNALLGEQAFPHRAQGVWGKMVAREGLEPPTPGL